MNCLKPANQAVKVWDLPTRLFHWALVVCVVGAVVSAKMGGNAMEWHFRFGLATLALLAFRLIWGVIGPRYARFRSFAYSPGLILRHLILPQGDSLRHAGHSPTGAASVFTLLTLLVIQTGSGLFSSDSISVEGPLAHLIKEASVSWLTWLHVTAQWFLIGFVSLHVLAILFYQWVKKINLSAAMFTGYKKGVHAPPADDGAWVRIAGLSLLAALLGLVFWFFR